MLSLEEHIADVIIEMDVGENYRVKDVIESYAEQATNDIMDDLGLNEESSFAIISTAIANAIEKEIDWAKVDTILEESWENAMAWFDAKQSAIEH